MLSLLDDEQLSVRWLAAEAGKLLLVWLLTAGLVVLFWACYLAVTGQLMPERPITRRLNAEAQRNIQ